MERPNLTDIPADVVAYIESLEAKLATKTRPSRPEAPLPEPSEPPTTIHIITVSHDGHAKRTPRHLYYRQRRGGMGVFDLETPEDNPPRLLAVADESETLILLTDEGRAFRLAASALPQTEVRGRGVALSGMVALRPEEKVIAILAEGQGTHLAVVSKRGWVRRLPASFVGRSLFQGTTIHNIQQGGPLTSACWTNGKQDLFIATEQGQALRFSEHHVRDRNGCLGLRVAQGDVTIAITAVDADGGVFLLGDNGKGTLRLMTGFRQNKAPGAGGKVAMKVDKLVGAVAVEQGDDIFAISRLSKMIRFQVAEVPAKTGVVQGVNCLSLRADEAVGVVPGRVTT